MLSVGPVSVSVAVFALAVAIAAIVGAMVARRHSVRARPGVASLILDIVLIGLLAARIGFVIEWLPRYLEAPWSILRIDDGGFAVWPGVLAATAFAIWRARRAPAIRRPLGAAMLAGWASWALLSGSLFLINQTALPLPVTELARLDGSTTTLAALKGKPMVVNLWATWCPPCRREMPLLAEAQQTRSGITFVFVNQGEGHEKIQRYLSTEHLQLQNVLLDPFGEVGRTVGSRALPTTLIFDASGTLIRTHIGEFSRASLAATLRRIAPKTAGEHSSGSDSDA